MRGTNEMGRPPKIWTYNYIDLAKMTGTSVNTVQQAASRGYFDPEKIETVFLWLVRNAKPSLKKRMVEYLMATRKLTEHSHHR